MATLTTMSTVAGGTEDVAYVVSFGRLKINGNELPSSGQQVLSFQVTTISTGTLEYFDLNGNWQAITITNINAGLTVLVNANGVYLKNDTGSDFNGIANGTGQQFGGGGIRWTGATDINGTLNAFRVKASESDIALVAASAGTVQVKVTLAVANDAPVLNGGVDFYYNTGLTIVEDTAAGSIAGATISNVISGRFADVDLPANRSEERRVGKECCR